MYNKYLSFDAYLSNGVVEANECSEATNKLYNGITLLFMQVDASWERIINVHSVHYMHMNFSVLMAPSNCSCMLSYPYIKDFTLIPLLHLPNKNKLITFDRCLLSFNWPWKCSHWIPAQINPSQPTCCRGVGLSLSWHSLISSHCSLFQAILRWTWIRWVMWMGCKYSYAKDSVKLHNYVWPAMNTVWMLECAWSTKIGIATIIIMQSESHKGKENFNPFHHSNSPVHCLYTSINYTDVDSYGPMQL